MASLIKMTMCMQQSDSVRQADAPQCVERHPFQASVTHLLSMLRFSDLCLVVWTLHEAAAGHKLHTMKVNCKKCGVTGMLYKGDPLDTSSSTQATPSGPYAA